MSKKKSYMNIKNILTEAAIGNFLRGLFKGKKGLKRSATKIKSELDKNVNNFNKTQSRLEKAIEKQWGQKVNLPRTSTEELIKKAR